MAGTCVGAQGRFGLQERRLKIGVETSNDF
jgi:hypothetical protein